MKNKRSPAQIAATKRMLAARKAKLGSATFTKRNPVKAKSKVAAKPAPAAARVSKRKPKRKSNPVAASKPAPRIASNPTENPVKANRRRRKQSRKQRAASLRNLRKARRSRKRRRNPVATTKGNPVKANRRRKRRRNPVKGNFRAPGERRQIARRRNLHMGRVGGYRRKGFVRGHSRRTNPVGGLFKNQGPFTGRNLTNYGMAAIGLGLGLFATDVVDRLVATRTPTGGARPWFGRVAVAAQFSRPDAMRLGAQAATGLASLGIAYLARNVPFVPWFFTGVAFAAGATLVKMGLQWWVGPMIFPLKGDDLGKPILANRLFVAEQNDVQNAVASVFKKENWTQSLLDAQAPTPIIRPVLGGDLGAPGIYTLGGLDPRDIIEIVRSANVPNQLAGPDFAADGTTGTCSKCGATGGHRKSCEDYCATCSGVFEYEVDTHDNLIHMTGLAGVDPNYVAGLNGARSLTTIKAGEKIKVPFLFGRWLQDQYGENLERHPGNQNAPEPIKRAAGQDFTEVMTRSPSEVIDPAE